MTAEETAGLVSKYGEAISDIHEQIALALSHEAHKKYPTNQRGYVDNWLRREKQNRAPRLGVAPTPVRRAVPVAEDPEWIGNQYNGAKARHLSGSAE